jgi:predicted ABC-type ATPase
MDVPQYDQRPIVLAIAGPNGAGKTTFFHSHLAAAGFRFVNADVIARELDLGPYEAAQAADAFRRELLKRGERFVFETVPDDKLLSRFHRTLGNPRLAMRRLPHVLIYDNSDLRTPFRQVAVFEQGELREVREPVPEWLRPMIDQ